MVYMSYVCSYACSKKRSLQTDIPILKLQVEYVVSPGAADCLEGSKSSNRNGVIFSQ